MKPFFLALFIVYLPLVCLYVYQRNNVDYSKFRWGRKNRIGVYLAIIFALIILFANPFFPQFVSAIEVGWTTLRGHSGGEYYFFIQWLIALTLLIFPHIIKRDNWSDNPTPSQIARRFNANTYWYGGLAFSVLPIYGTYALIS